MQKLADDTSAKCSYICRRAVSLSAFTNWKFVHFLNAYFSYNSSLRKTRVIIEHTFGCWKRRFGLLHQENRREIENVCKDIAACAILHNIAMEEALPDIDDDEDNYEDNNIDFPYMEGDNAYLHRTNIIQNIFNI
jgi:hypothetical protein